MGIWPGANLASALPTWCVGSARPLVPPPFKSLPKQKGRTNPMEKEDTKEAVGNSIVRPVTLKVLGANPDGYEFMVLTTKNEKQVGPAESESCLEKRKRKKIKKRSDKNEAF